MVIVEARSVPNQGFVRPPYGLRVVVMSNVGLLIARRHRTARPPRHAGAPAEREQAGDGRKPAKKRAAGNCSLVLQQTSNDHTEPSEHWPPSAPASFLNYNEGGIWAGGAGTSAEPQRILIPPPDGKRKM